MIYKREIAVRHSVDVFVAGGGLAGVAAAVSCASLGKTVFLAESDGCFGGMGTKGLVPFCMSFGDGTHFLVGDVGRKIRDGISDYRGNDARWYTIDPEQLKMVLDHIVVDSGVNFSFFTSLIDVECADDRITHAILAAKSGVFAVEAKIFIDCTGDADVIAMAGAEFEMGDENGHTMPPTLCSKWANVGRPAKPMDEEALERAIKDGVFQYADRHVPGMIRIRSGRGIMIGNMGHCFGVDGTDERSLTEGMITGRKQVRQFEKFYREYIQEGYADMDLCETASVLGVRETRRMKGEYVLCLDDFLKRASFPDEIGRYSYPVDIHIKTPDKDSYEEYLRLYQNLRYQPGETYGIPYRALIPCGLKNVLAAGRCISADQYMQSSLRVMPCCMLTGQAAGTAASMACDIEDVRSVDTEELRRILREHDVWIP